MQLPIVGVSKQFILFICLILLVSCSVHRPIEDFEGISLADRQQIEQLIADYSYSFDSGDINVFSELFVEQGSLLSSVGDAKSRSEIYDWGIARHKLLSELGVKSRHIQTNTRLEISAQRVTGKTQLLLMRTDVKTGATSLRAEGTYHDEFVKTRYGWRFLSRKIGVDAR